MKKLCPIILVLMAVIGCSMHKITTPLTDTAFPAPATVTMGTISDALPVDMDPADRPSAEAVDELRSQILGALVAERVASADVSSNPKYRVDGDLISYSKGNGFVRFLFGYWGAAKITVQLSLVEIGSGKEVFAGSFKGAVTSGYEKGNKMFEQVAKDFAKQIKKQREKLLKG